MFNRYVWLFTLIFWLAVIAVAGWQGVAIVIVFCICAITALLLTDRSIKHD